jgi:primosomal protein N' (replication factor Y)
MANAEQANFLLHGVTGSGKTEVYLQALAKAVSLGRRAIVLVPEIALTPQTVRRFAERFPSRVAVMHSGLSLGEQYDEWHAIAEGRYDVVIGARSAIFAPQPDLGLIVIDEEHEWTYKQQDPAPRYNARLVAERLAELSNAVLILGSATPSIDTYYQAVKGRYRLLTLSERIQISNNGHRRVSATTALPEVKIVSMREELKSGNYGIFSTALLQALGKTLEAREQAILFVNRRGSASFIQCQACGFVPRCTSCAVSLTYHAVEQALICHYCHRRRAVPSSCPQCRGVRIRQQGIGTQRLEEEVHRLFPQARVLRWDRDVTRGRHAHERILDSFLSHEADVLIGTQMVAKGLDIPLVTLVGVVAADINLYLPDYNSAERTYQLLSQVAGRAGRGEWAGRVIVQTYSPKHYAIEAAAEYDYQGFYRTETALRRACGYPPYGELARLIFAHTNEAKARQEAERVAHGLRQDLLRRGLPNLQVLGPTPAFVSRLRGRYRWQIVLKGREPSLLLESLSLPEGWTVDIDPVSLL